MESPDNKKKLGPKACGTCAKAKARCIPSANPDKCERCDRLNKPCPKQAAATPRIRKEPRPTRVADLEKKLEVLRAKVDASSSNSERDGSSQVPCSAGPNNACIGVPTALFPGYDHVFPSYRAGNLASVNKDGAGTTALELPDNGTVKKYAEGEVPWPNGFEAALFLEEYRTKIVPIFPFVIPPPDMSAEQLQWEKPLTWKAIMIQACNMDGQRQSVLCKDLLKEIFDNLFVKPKKSVDLLQSLIIYIAWCHFYVNAFQVTNLLFLARSICVSFGMNEGKTHTSHAECGSGCLEKLRACAGVYFLITVVFTTSKRPDSLMNTPYVEAISQALEQRMEYPTDALAVQLVKIQQISQTISMTLTSDSISSQSIQYCVSTLTMLIKGLQAQIDGFKMALPSHLQDNECMTSHIYIAEIQLYDIALQANPMVPSTSRLELLWSLLAACKGYMTCRFAKPFTIDSRYICISSFDFMFCFTTCLKLATLEAPGWDLPTVRRELRLGALVDRQIDDLQKLVHRRRIREGSAGSRKWTDEQDPFQKLVNMLKGLQSVIHNMSNQPNITQTATPPVDVTMEDESAGDTPAMLEFLTVDFFEPGQWNPEEWGSAPSLS